MPHSHTRGSRAYTLTETVVVLGLVLLAVTAVVVGALSWQTRQRTDRVTATLDAVVTAEQLHHGRFGVFTADPAALARLVADVAVVPTSTGPGEAVVVVGVHNHPTEGMVDAASVGVTDGAECTWVRVPDLDVRVERASGRTDGACDTTTVSTAAEVTP